MNEAGQRAQTRPCPRPGCGSEVPIRRYSYETLRQIGWPLFRVARYGEWCGHGQELIPVPDEGQWVRLVPGVGTGKEEAHTQALGDPGLLRALQPPARQPL